MRPCIQVEASPEQEATLRMRAGSWKVERRLAMRAKVVLLSLEGLSLKEIPELVGLSWQAPYNAFHAGIFFMVKSD